MEAHEFVAGPAFDQLVGDRLVELCPPGGRDRVVRRFMDQRMREAVALLERDRGGGDLEEAAADERGERGSAGFGEIRVEVPPEHCGTFHCCALARREPIEARKE